ncbi:hypothetical protein HW537_05400 [Asaia siamensis]
MSKNSTSHRNDVPALDADVKAASQTARDVKTDDHGAFRVHVQLLGQEWSQTH